MNRNRWMAAAGIVVGMALAACGGETAEAAGEAPAEVEVIDESGLSRITLTEQAVARLALETATVGPAGGEELTVPYGAVFYDANGQAWVYTSPAERVYVRDEIEVDRIDGEVAILAAGPPVGTSVVTVGVAELYGTETGVGGGGH